MLCSLRVTFLYDSSLFISINCCCLQQRQALESLQKKYFPENFPELIGKHLPSRSFNVVFAKFFRAPKMAASIYINKYLN